MSFPPAPERAEWRLRPQDDWRPVACFWRGFRERPWAGYAGWIGLMALLGLIVYVTHGAVAIFAFMGLGAGRRLLRRADPEQLALMARPAAEAQFPVDVEFREEGLFVGRDRGIVSFGDGWLHYEGLQTAFSLRAVDATVLGFPNTGPVLACGAKGKSRVDFFPRDEMDGHDGLGDAFALALDGWRERRLFPIGQPLLPPSSPHPEAYYRVRLRQVRCLVVAVVGMILLGAGLQVLAFGFIRMPSPLVVLLCFGPGMALIALAERRRAFAEEERLREFAQNGSRSA